VGVLDRLLKRIRRVKTAKFQSSEWFLLHDNAPSHNAAIVKKFLANRNVANLYPFPVHVVTFTFHYQLTHLLIKNTFHRSHLKLHTLKMSVMRTQNYIKKPNMFRSVLRPSSGVNHCALRNYYVSACLPRRIPVCGGMLSVCVYL